MHRRKLRKYAILKDIFGLLGGTALLVLIATTGGYCNGSMTFAMFALWTVISGEAMAICYMAYRCVQCREHRYLRIRELKKRKQQEMKKSA
ncbi:hypothetical protein ACI3DN_12480 [Sellimonas catena]|uniref:Uncharacterized protein n=1 Tax=Sellimonas catena TaxID=2994035 RepID=A0A9W6CAL3_9FIRM|nr:hypothetical protein [Sellimonas catena]GLG06163.1 hypothetical protein Selli1_33370 [Sellimonas catena]